MKVHVDLAVCEAHGECTYAAPEVFELDDDDELHYDTSPAEEDGPRRGDRGRADRAQPRRTKRMRVRVPKPARSFLELDELAALLEAAAAEETLPSFAAEILAGEGTQARVARRIAAGKRPSDIARELGLTKSTVSFHLGHLGVPTPGGYIGRRAVIEVLARSGVRASELCDLRVRDVRLHEAGQATRGLDRLRQPLRGQYRRCASR